MTSFNGLGDWETNEIGDELCTFLKKDNRKQGIKSRKIKKKKVKTKLKNLPVNNGNVANFLTRKASTSILSKVSPVNEKVSLKTRIKDMKNNKKAKKLRTKLNMDTKNSKNAYTLLDNTSAEGNTLKSSLDKSKSQNKKQKRKLDDVSGSNKVITPNIHTKKKKKIVQQINNDTPALKKEPIISDNLIKRKKRIEAQNNETKVLDKEPINPSILRKRKKQLESLKALIKENKNTHKSTKPKPVLTLRQKMMKKLKAARFRFLNEQMYVSTGREAQKIFNADKDAFKAYHDGYRQQVNQWPLNPLDVIIKSIIKMPKTHIIADFGCGEARLAKEVKQTVHSFDLVAANSTVTACDMAKVPLEDGTVDVAVFCLSLMGTNLQDYLREANRVLKLGGIFKIAEVESRFEDINHFIKSCEQYGFKKHWLDLSHNLFYFIDLKKSSNVKTKSRLSQITLQPCLYKRR
ncbi:ribosomal RNA-processing protein 8 [Sitophilus oryzae]|uniref:Ribosomal RNA-processing protein 8 n=1 Tax=Sitophilus oryzae TaxID=7048 RepID=A0A6J2YGB8_SITOR|nr:ribosomal RNA-processing protein 8 [Sitophilus oryzae]